MTWGRSRPSVRVVNEIWRGSLGEFECNDTLGAHGVSWISRPYGPMWSTTTPVADGSSAVRVATRSKISVDWATVIVGRTVALPAPPPRPPGQEKTVSLRARRYQWVGTGNLLAGRGCRPSPRRITSRGKEREVAPRQRSEADRTARVHGQRVSADVVRIARAIGVPGRFDGAVQGGGPGPFDARVGAVPARDLVRPAAA